MSRRVTIDDVARQAGVSKVTVSYVLNGRSADARISAPTQTKVREAASTLGYRANALARSLSTQRTDTLAVVFQSGAYFSAWSAFTSEVMRGVSEVCFEAGYDLVLHTKAVSSPEDEAANLSDGRVDGVLVLRDEDDKTLLELIARRTPCVQFFTHSENLSVPSVDLDNELGGRLATQHLLGLGHRNIAMICGSARSVSSSERIRGYATALRKFGIEPRPEWIMSATDSEEDMTPILEVLTGPDHPTGVFVWSDDIALKLLRDLRNRGLRVPEDISVVGFDSLPAAETAVPALTSVRQPVRTMAAEAARMLIDALNGRPIATPKVFFEPILDIRASTAPTQNASGER
jgi:LacI family transcriptional regulator